MSREVLGKVLDKCTPYEFSFVSARSAAGHYVAVDVEGSTMIGEIIEREAVNPYFNKPTVLAYLPEDNDDINSQALYVSKVRPVGRICDGKRRDVDIPPKPGSNVYSAAVPEIRLALALGDQGADIGTLKAQPDVKVLLPLDVLFRTHLCVLGRTGSGKSFFVKGLIDRISRQGPQTIILTPSDEYDDLAFRLGYEVYGEPRICLPFTPTYIAMTYGLTYAEQIVLESFMKDQESEIGEGAHSSRQIAASLRSWLGRGKEKITRLTPVQGSFSADVESDAASLRKIPPRGSVETRVDTILSKVGSKDLWFSAHPMRVPFETSTVLNLSRLSAASQEAVTAYVLGNLLESKRRERGADVFLVLEEAHMFAPSVQTTACKEKIVQLAREGRKLGVSLCLISQRPRHLDQTALSQCGSIFIFNLPHPDDVEHTFGVSPVYSSELIEAVRRLGVGECLIVGDVVKYPVVCRVDFREAS